MAISDAGCRADVASGALVRLEVKDLPEVYPEMGIVVLVNRTPSPIAAGRSAACRRRPWK
jgi:hypothetical protein